MADPLEKYCLINNVNNSCTSDSNKKIIYTNKQSKYKQSKPLKLTVSTNYMDDYNKNYLLGLRYNLIEEFISEFIKCLQQGNIHLLNICYIYL